MRHYDININDISNQEFYTESLNKAIRLFRNVKGVKSIYQFGSLAAPGCSDIDLLFVIEPDKNISKTIFEVYESEFTPEEKYVLYEHDPLIIGIEMAGKINHIRECKNLNYLWGQHIKFEINPDVYFKFYVMIEFMIAYSMSNLYYNNEDCPLRWRYQVINAFENEYSLFNSIRETLGIEDIPADNNHDLFKLNNELRNNPNNLIEEPKLLKEIELSLNKMIFDMNVRLDKCVSGYIRKAIRERVWGGYYFTNDYKQELKRFNVLGRSFTLGRLPLSYYSLFGDLAVLDNAKLREAITARNHYVDLYCSFINNYVFGRTLYLPWWKTKSLSRFLRFVPITRQVSIIFK